MGIICNGNTVVLENEYYRRVIETGNGIATKTFHIRPGGEKLSVWYPVFSFEESAPFEAAVTVDGKNYEAGPYERHSQADLWRREGAFSLESIVPGKGDYGDTVEFALGSRLPGMPELELDILYEVADDLPLVRKKVRVRNRGRKAVTVDALAVDILKFFDRRLPLSVFSDYYKDVRKEDLYYFTWTRMEFPDELEMVLEPGEEMESFDLYEAVTAVDRQEESVILQRIYKRLAPWICELRPSLCVSSCGTAEELYRVAEEAAENGIERVALHVGQVFTNTGDYIPRPDLFPGGYPDVKKLIDRFHEKNIKVLPYCSATIAWRDTQVCREHPDWQCLGPEGLRYDPFGLGNMCYHSPWGDYIREKLFYLISDEVGFDGLALDGPVHGLVCQETNHKHRSEKSVNFMNWMWEKKFYGEVVAKGKMLTAPETWNALLMGISKIPGGYREEDQNEFGGLDFVTMCRSCIYEARYATPPCAHTTSFNMDEYHGHSVEASEENPASYEHALAGMFGYGLSGDMAATRPYIGENTKRIYRKWLHILQTYRETLLGDFIHLAQPNGYDPDGVLHTNARAEAPGLAVLFNPTGEEKEFAVTLPMKYASLQSGSQVQIEGRRIRLDSVSNAQVIFSLAPYEVKAVPILRA